MGVFGFVVLCATALVLSGIIVGAVWAQVSREPKDDPLS